MFYIQGDLISFAEATLDLPYENKIAFVHGCNCFCTMGSGVAKQFRDRFPHVYEADLKTKKGDCSKLGSYTYAEIAKNVVVINAYTQYNYGRDPNKVYVDYGAVEKVFSTLADDFQDYAFVIPKIGAGLAGGDWEIISDKIADSIRGELYVVEYNKNVPKQRNHFQQLLFEFVGWSGLTLEQMGSYIFTDEIVRVWMNGKELPSDRMTGFAYLKIFEFEKRPPLIIRVTEKYRAGELECVIFGFSGESRAALLECYKEQDEKYTVGKKVVVYHKVSDPDLILRILTGNDTYGLKRHLFFPTFVNTKTGESYEF